MHDSSSAGPLPFLVTPERGAIATAAGVLWHSCGMRRRQNTQPSHGRPERVAVPAFGTNDARKVLPLYSLSLSIFHPLSPVICPSPFVLCVFAGTLGFGLGRETEVICGARRADGSYERSIYTFSAKNMGWEKEVSSRRSLLSECGLPVAKMMPGRSVGDDTTWGNWSCYFGMCLAAYTIASYQNIQNLGERLTRCGSVFGSISTYGHTYMALDSLDSDISNTLPRWQLHVVQINIFKKISV